MDKRSTIDPLVPTLLPGRSAEQTNRQQIREGSPFTAFQYVDVAFSGADTDYDVLHGLRPFSPEDIDYQVVRANCATSIYDNQLGARRLWGTGYIVLRSSAANAKVTLLLTIRR